MWPATGAPQRAREQARRIPVKTLAGGIQAEHGIAEELEPVKCSCGGRQAAVGSGGRAQDWGGRSRSYSAGICGSRGLLLFVHGLR